MAKPSVTPADYAIEHGGYLATAAKDFLDACNRLVDARMLAEAEEAGDETFEALERAQESYGENFSGLREAVYEFEKRRDRAINGAPACHGITLPPSTEGGCRDTPQGNDGLAGGGSTPNPCITEDSAK